MTATIADKTDLINGRSAIKSLLLLAVPIVIASILQMAYQLIDTFWVGRLGAAAVAAVSVSFPFLFLLIAAGGGLTITASMFVAQYAGAKNQDMVNHAAGQALVLTLVISLGFALLGYIAAPFALRLMNVEPDVFTMSLVYLRLIFCGVVFKLLFMVFQAILRGIGEVRFPLYVILLTVVLNALIDPLLIFGWGPIPGYGVAGAAYATLLTQLLGAIIGIAALARGRFGIILRRENYLPDWDFMRRSIRLGVPASIEQSTRSFAMLVMTFLAAMFGTLGLATMGLGIRIISLFIIPAMGLSMATSTLVGQSIGAGDYKRATAVSLLSLKLGFWLLSGLGVILFIFAEPIIRLFVPTDEALVASTALYVRIAAPAFGFMAAEQALTGTLRAAGDLKPAMMIALGTQWLIQLPLIVLLSRYTTLGLEGIWWGFPASTLLSALLTYWWFRRGHWQQISLTQERQLVRQVTEEIIIEEAIPFKS